MKQAVILAGGKGTRLKHRLHGLPKPLVDICGMPLLERQILLCKRYGVTDILILVNHAAEQIVTFCAAKNNWGLNIRCLDDGEPRGTAGAVMAAFPYLEHTFIVLYGDTMLDVDLLRFAYCHKQANPAATLFLHPNDHPHDSDLVDMDETGKITAFYPYPHANGAYYPNLVNAALYVIKKKGLEPWLSIQGTLDFAKDIFPRMLTEGQLLRGYNSPEYIKDCGTPERLDKVCADFQTGLIARRCLDKPQPTVFLDRDGTLNHDVPFIARAEDFELFDNAAAAIRRLNRSPYRTVLITNQPVIARGDCTPEKLKHIHNKMETLLGREGAYIDRIYYCPHHPDRGFYGEVAELKIACDCRKPGIGMVKQAQRDLNVDMENSWLVGDSTADMLTAQRAGLKSILVQTGNGGNDGKFKAAPTIIAPNLSAAVDQILGNQHR